MKTIQALTLTAIAPFALSVTLVTPVMADTAMRETAARVVSPMMQEIAPGRGGEVFTTCVVQSATDDEITVIAMAAVTGPSADTGAMISTILARPETLVCAQAMIAG